jgi:hypothetical protein
LTRIWAITLVMLAATAAIAQEESTLPQDPAYVKAAYVRPMESPNYQALPNAPSARPLTDREKFEVFADDARSPLTFLSAGVSAGYNTAANRVYGSGWNGFGRNYAAAVAEHQTANFFGKYLFPTLLSQDPRYHPSEKDGFWSRSTYAATRVLITRRDNGQKTINSSYLLGVLVSSAIAASYQPVRRTSGQTLADFGSTVGGDAGMNILKEFWPQLRSTLRPMAPKKLRDFGGRMMGHEERVGLVDLNKN